MRICFFVLAGLASGTSAVGIGGMWAHDPREVLAASRLLPPPWGEGAPQSPTAPALSAARPPHGSSGPALRQAAHAEDAAPELVEFLARPFSSGLRKVLDDACPREIHSATAQCSSAIVRALAQTWKAQVRAQRAYRHVLAWSRLLWCGAGFLAVLMLVRAYDRLRRDERRASRPTPAIVSKGGLLTVVDVSERPAEACATAVAVAVAVAVAPAEPSSTDPALVPPDSPPSGRS